ncbi:MAG: polysulfide reductase NrfD [Chloroflexota bacterium]|nr:polysulfide reductase NrfD [Chloroflexota bacterium]
MTQRARDGQSRPVRRQKSAAHVHARDAYQDVPILQTPTWDNDIAAYFFLGGISSGAFVFGALADLVGGDERRGLARAAHLVSFLTLLPCPALLIDDLGKPSRFHHMLRIFKPSSPMNLGSWTLTGHGLFAALLTARSQAEAGGLPLVGRPVRALPAQAMAMSGLPTALTLGGYTGVLLGTTSIPVWSTSPLLGALFMASALGTGAAATVVASTLMGADQPGDDALLAPLHLTLGCTELALLGGYLATSGQAVKPLRHGREGLLLLGAVAAAVTALALDVAGMRFPAQRHRYSVLAATAVLVGGACLRWAVVRAGHVSATDRAGTLAATRPSRAAPGWGSG